MGKFPFILEKEVNKGRKKIKVNIDILPGKIYELDENDLKVQACLKKGRLFPVGPASNTAVVQESKKKSKDKGGKE